MSTRLTNLHNRQAGPPIDHGRAWPATPAATIAPPATPAVAALLAELDAAFESASRRFVLKPPQLRAGRDRAKAIAAQMQPDQAVAYLTNIAIPAFRRVADQPGTGPGGTVTELRMDYFHIEPPSRIRAW